MRPIYPLLLLLLLPLIAGAQPGSISWPAACPTNNCPTAYTDPNGVQVTVTSAYGTGTGAAVNLQQLQGSTAGVFGVSQTSSAPSATQGLSILLNYGTNYTDATTGNIIKIAFDKAISGSSFVIYDITSPWLSCSQMLATGATYNDNVVVTGTATDGSAVQATLSVQSNGYFAQTAPGSTTYAYNTNIPVYMRNEQSVINGDSAYVTGGYVNTSSATNNAVDANGFGGASLSVNVSFPVPVKAIQILYKNYSGGYFSYYKFNNSCPAAITTANFAKSDLAPQGIFVGNIAYTAVVLSLGGSVLNDPNGAANGVNGTALQNTTVTLFAADGTTVIATTTTDASGNYRFDVSPNTTYVVKVTPPSGYANVSSTDATPADGSTTVVVGSSAAGNITGINFGLNQPPLAVNDSLNNQPGGVPATVPNILGNDTDPNGGTLRADSITLRPSSINIPGVTYTTDAQGDTLSVTVPGQGTWSLNSTNGSVTFTPQAGLSGNPTPINYTVTDAAGLPSNPATIVISFTYPPVAVNDTATTPMNTPLNGNTAANDTCRMGPCNYTVLSSDPPAHGTVTVNSNGTYTYTPNTGFTGKDTFSYVLCNSATPTALCDTALVFLTVTGAPVTVNDTATTPMNTPLNGNTAANDTCRMGPCNYTALSSDPPAHGTVTVNVNGTYTYTPSNGFTGKDTFSYVLCNSATPTALCDTAQVFLTVTGAPVAVNDTATTPMNTPLNSSVTANDTCRIGPCNYTALSSDLPTHGTATVNSNGTYTYTPNTGFTGKDTFSYVLCNSATPTALCDTAQVFLTVTGAPVAVNDTATTLMNTPLNSSVTANDTCRMGPCNYTALSSDLPTHGTVTVNSNGTYTYTPNTGFTGKDTFSYALCNSATPTALCDTAQVFLTITGAPVAVNDTATTPMNTPLNSSVSANDTCRMGPCNYTALSSDPPAHGTVTVNSNGTYTYTPGAGFTGKDTFSYVLCNSATPTALCDTAQVFLTITGAPVAVNDAATTPMNTPLNSSVTANDTCRMGPCNYTALSSDLPTHGTVTVNSNGTYTYTPNTGFTGKDTFSYALCNSATPTALCDTAQVFLTVTGAPVAVNDTATTPMNTPLNSSVTANDTCRMGPCNYTALSSDLPTHGTVTVNNNGTYTYTPNNGFTGNDTFSYVLCNSATPTALCDTAQVFLTITGAPVAVNDTTTTPMNTPLNSSVTANDTCRMGPCNYTALSSDPPAHGTVTVNNSGTYTYTPNTGFTGKDTFSYVVCNSGTPMLCDTAQVFLTVTGAPMAVNDTATTPMNTPLNSSVTANDTCRMGPCNYSADPSGQPANGTVAVNSNGTYTYTPNPGFTGTDTFSYVLCNSATPATLCDTAQVFLTVTGAPVAVNDTATTPMNTPLNSSVTANDTCRTGPCNYTALSSGLPTHGTVTVNNSGTYTYTPNTGFTGKDTFSYVLCNSATPTALCDTAQVFLTITGAPVAVNDTTTTPMNTPLNSSVTANDTCRMGPCNYTALSSDPPAHGTVTVNNSGTYTYTPNTGFTGKDTFSYVVCNSGTPVLCDTAQVFLTITGTPVAVNDTATTPMNTPLNSSVTANDTCRMGPCNYTALSSDLPTHGTVTVNNNGTYTYTPGAGFTGKDTFSYVLCNSATPTALCDTAQVFLTITGAPVAVNDTATTPMNTPLNSSVTANDTCRMGPCNYTALSSDPPANGTVTVNSNGTYTYTPNTGFTGKDTFSYMLCNSATPTALCDTAQVFLTVTGTPVAVNDTASTPANTPVNGSLAGNDTCSATTCSYSALSSDPPRHGVRTVNTDGSYTYTPDPNFNGKDTFGYVLCNGGAPSLCDTAQVSITVGTPLPVVLVSFKALAEADCDVLLSWTTGLESGFDHFDIEWSNEGSKFVPVSSVPAKGSGSSYRYLFRNGVKGKNYYRLKETDRDGSYLYSHIESVTLGCTIARNIKVYPTVHSSQITVDGLQAGESVAVYDMKGISILQAKAEGPVMRLNLSHTAQGSYTVVVITLAGERMYYKIVKQ